MKISFKRITSSGNFIPEIDGLRFIAITSVVLYHLSGFIIAKDYHQYSDNFDYSFLKTILSRGDLGVPLFFSISGFILGLPFANYYLGKEKPVSLKKYFLRRLTRLEPPYILTMLILFLGSVFVAKSILFDKGIHSFFSSLFYSHNFVYPKSVPFLNGVAWSLEIEVQFYIFAPLMAKLFLIKSAQNRRMIFFAIAVISLFLSYFVINLPFICLINFIHFFLIGFVLADLYVSKSSILPKTKYDYLIGLIFFIIIWIFKTRQLELPVQQFIWELTQIICIFIFYYYVLFHKIFKVLSFKLITNIGGMCYSIYLLHYAVISMLGNPLMKFTFSNYSFINISIYSIVLIFILTIITSAFFLLIERPCMDKNWYKKGIKIIKP